MPNLLDFVFIRGILNNYCRIESCFELSSDHSCVIFTGNSKIMIKGKPCTLCQNKMALFPGAFKDYIRQLHLTKIRR